MDQAAPDPVGLTLSVEPRHDVVTPVAQATPDNEAPRPAVGHAPVAQRRHRHAEQLGDLLDRLELVTQWMVGVKGLGGAMRVMTSRRRSRIESY
jgi:hypothetical protein